MNVVFLTSGDKADPSHTLSKTPAQNPGGFSNAPHITQYALLREQEAVSALDVLGVGEYAFLRFPDRELHGSSHLVSDRIYSIVVSYVPDAIYSPSPVELNPDHRTSAGIALALQRRMLESGMSASLVFYEVTTPLRPNLLVDITSVFSTKESAIEKYGSQLQLGRYLECITAINTFRTLTAGGTGYIEAFWQMPEPLSNGEIAGWLGYSGVFPLRAS